MFALSRPLDRPPKEKPQGTDAPGALGRHYEQHNDSATQGAVQEGSGNQSRTPRKWQRILAALVGGRTLNRFEAARELRDWCLNTTISQLEQRGVRISRHDETVPGAFGPVRCCRYRLAPESLQRARELLSLTEAAP